MKEIKHTWETEERFYIAILCIDLFDHWILDLYWGGKRNHKRGSKVIVCADYNDGLAKFKKLSYKRQARGYV